MSNLLHHAKRELELAGMIGAQPDADDPNGVFNDYNEMVSKAVLELVETFSNQGHSGFSASMVSELFYKVSKYETLTENDHSSYIEHEVDFWQDSRDSRYFSSDQGKTWYNVDDR